MIRQILNRSSLVLIPVAALFAGCTTPDRGPQPTRVLMIGNSFSVSMMRHAPSVADSLAIDFDITSLYIGGCSLKKHMDNVKREWNVEHKPYSMTRNIRGVAQPSKKVNLPEVLKGEVKYDIVTVQQASHESWDPATYAPYGDDLVKLIREYQPQAKIYVQETWSYTPWDPRFKKWGIDQNEMYEKLHKTYGDFAKQHGFDVIPFGTAVQEWRRQLPVKYAENSFGGDVVGGGKQEARDHFKRDVNNDWKPNCDVFHLGRRGEYFQALVWAKALFGADVSKLKYKPDYVTDDEAKLMKKIAMEVK